MVPESARLRLYTSGVRYLEIIEKGGGKTGLMLRSVPSGSTGMAWHVGVNVVRRSYLSPGQGLNMMNIDLGNSVEVRVGQD